jgi:hypothetical protein
MRQNPFELWQAWRSEACGPVGDDILRLCDEAADLLPASSALLAPIELHRVAVEWVRMVERAYQRYAERDIRGCALRLAAGHALLERLRPGLEQAVAAAGSLADLTRLDVLIEKLERVCRRVRALPGGAGYRPAFETLVRDDYVPGDQAAWHHGA